MEVLVWAQINPDVLTVTPDGGLSVPLKLGVPP